MARLPGYRVVTDSGTAARTLATLEQRTRHRPRVPGRLSGFVEHDVAHSILEAAALLSRDDDRLLAAVMRTPNPLVRLSLMLGVVRRALKRLVVTLVAASIARLIPAADQSWQPRPAAPEADLSPAGPLVRAHAILTAAPPFRPLAIAGTAG